MTALLLSDTITHMVVHVNHRNDDTHAETVSEAEATEPDWSGECIVCGESPIVPVTGMCGPCTFGEADTIGGNW